MANKNSQENAQRQTLEDFVRSYRTVKEVSRIGKEEEAESVGRTSNYEALQSKKIETVYNYVSKKYPELFGSIPNANELKTKLKPEEIDAYFSEIAKSESNKASNILQSNLEKILENTSLENKEDRESYEKVVLDEKIGPVIQKAASDDYKEWYNKYRESFAFMDLAKRAKEGKLEPREKESLMSKYAIEIAEKVKTKAIEQGLNTERQNSIFALAYRAAMAGTAGDKTTEIAEKMYNETQEKLKKYEAETGKNIKGYVTSALSKLVNGDAQEFAIAREITYELVENKVK